MGKDGNKVGALIERIEQAEGPSRELDDEIYRACFENPAWRNPNWVNPSRFTASLDGALKLMPEGWGWRMMFNPPHELNAGSWAQAWQDGNPAAGLDPYKGPTIYAQAATPALALCAAALKARNA